MKLHVYGTVQGVGFRPTVYRIATEMGLNGYVHNLGSHVEICIDDMVDEFIDRLLQELPPLARIERIRRVPGMPSWKGFRIIRSRHGKSTIYSQGIPVDTALCEQCIDEMLDPGNRRYLYPFTNCTNCGARFTLTKELPYDRSNTAMADFEMCPDCRKEYSDPMDRRFHAQTISCPKCGPHYTLYDSMGNVIADRNWEPLKEFANLLDSGRTGVIKSWGGMHIACIVDKIWDFRDWYKRREKPFAVMARDLLAVETIAELSDEERALLHHPSRPIVLLQKKRLGGMLDEFLEAIAPELNTIGLFLPYSGIHHVLFYFMDADFMIMTSANPRGEPMITENSEIFRLGADYYLLHNRPIINRCDDSVVRVFEERVFFVRKARGFIPDQVKIGGTRSVMAMGAEQNLTITVARRGIAYTTQYLGDAESYGVLEFAKEASLHLRRMLDAVEPEVIAVDLHPRYRTRRIGTAIAERIGAELVKVQHHHAHAASLMIDALEPKLWRRPFVCVVADGTGYGPDKTAWGGEVLVCDLREYERIGGLEPVPLIGGEMAIKYPIRIAFAMLDKHGIEHPLISDEEAETMRVIAKKAPLASGFGRFLDAISALFNICIEMTYDGEPAMKIEPYLERGEPVHRIEAPVEGRPPRVMTSDILAQIFEIRAETFKQKSDVIASAVYAALEALIEIARDHAVLHDRLLGFTGGVSYNRPICRMFVDLARKMKLKPVFHSQIPNGDGGISLGQAAIASRILGEEQA